MTGPDPASALRQAALPLPVRLKVAVRRATGAAEPAFVFGGGSTVLSATQRGVNVDADRSRPIILGLGAR
jgi:hypothetical protein